MQPLLFNSVQPSTATAEGLGAPAGAQMALIQALSANARWRDDGTAPTATTGMQLAAGDSIFYCGSLGRMLFISEGPGDTEINVSFYAH
jgi:hypothetical protein